MSVKIPLIIGTTTPFAQIDATDVFPVTNGSTGKTATDLTAATAGDMLVLNAGKTGYDFVSSPYKVYTALLTQTGTSAPTATILGNTLGVTPTFTYTTNGDYDIITSVDTFTANKTWVVCATGNQSDPAKAVPVLCSWTDAKTIRITTFPGGAGDDGYLVATPIEIRVYP